MGKTDAFLIDRAAPLGRKPALTFGFTMKCGGRRTWIMRWILPLILLTAVHAQPPSPPGFTPVLSPKQKELKESWGAPMIKVSYSPGVPIPMTGFAITNLSVANNQVSLSWINGVPPFQVIGEPTLYGPWNEVGIPTTARSKVFPEDINHFFTVQGNIVMPLTATQTNNLTRLTWEAPDTAMSDSLQAFTLKRSTDNGATFPTTVQVVQPGGTYSVDDTTAIPPGGSLTWELLEQTLNGVVVPYSKPVASNVAPGTALWAHGYGGADHDYGYGVAVDSSGAVYGCGQYGLLGVDFGTGTMPAFGSACAWLGKYTSAGTPVWTKGLGIGAGNSANCSVTAKGVSVLGGVVAMVGAFNGTVDFSSTAAVPGASKTAAGRDIFVALYSTSDGAFIWAKNFGSGSDCGATSVHIDRAGNVVVTGAFQGAVNFGDATRTSTSGSSIFLMKLAAADGATVWSKQLGGSVPVLQSGNSVATDRADPTDAVFVTGSFAGANADFGDGHTLTSNGAPTFLGLDIFIGKYRGSDGECLWVHGYGSSNHDYGTAIASRNGVVFLGGDVSNAGTSVGGPALLYAGGFVAKYLASDGSHVWSQSFPIGPIFLPQSTVNCIAIDSLGNAVVVGGFTGTMVLPAASGTISLTAAGGLNFFTVKFTAAGDGAGGGVALWAKDIHSTGGPFGDGSNTGGFGCDIGPDDSPVVVGQWNSTNVAGTTTYVLSIDGISIPALGNEDVLIVKLSP